MFRTFFALMYTSFYQSPIGLMKISASDTGLLSVLFTDEAKELQTDQSDISGNGISCDTAQQLAEYFTGKRKIFDIPLSPSGSPFQQSVWEELVKIPYGKTDCYSAIAHKLNNPLSVRAVGAANGKNPISIIVPCHRIIGMDGSLTGYAGGLWRKEYLLHLEGADKSVQTKLW